MGVFKYNFEWLTNFIVANEPIDVEVINIGPSSALITWNSPKEGYVNGKLEGYLVRYWSVLEPGVVFNKTVGVNTSLVELSNLHSLTNYQVMVSFLLLVLLVF